MSVTAAGSVPKRGGFLSSLWNRQLDTYPDTAPRLMYLGITVLATIMLYWELYVGGSVSTLFLQRFNMSFTFLVYTLAIGALIGAFGSLFAGITDRFGRTNIVVIGLFLTGLFTAFIIPAATNKWEFTIFGFIVGFVEGVCLVATPALIRDFSPQVGRATAMGFWTSGPVLGSLVVFVVASHTIGNNPSPAFWVHEYHISGIVGLVVFLIALFGLKELSPGLRDQLMVTMRDRALVEARAKGIDIEASLRNPFRQLLKLDVIISAVGVSLFLIIYYTAVGFALIYFTTVFGFSVHDGNALGNWNWGFNVIAVIAFGIISDKLRVRKPLMIAGGVGAAIMIIVYLNQIGHKVTYYDMAVILAALAFCLGVAYVPWMASFTETVEARNPALTATGLAIWGWIIRVVVFGSYLLLPTVINTVTPLVQYGGQVQALVVKYPAATLPPATLAALQKNPLDAQALAQAHAQLGPNYIKELLSLAAAPAADKAFLAKHGPAVANAAKNTGDQWKTWYWICFGGTIFFLFTVPLMRGRWSPKKARADEEAHEAMVQAELAKLSQATV
jgi:MFS family permease